MVFQVNYFTNQTLIRSVLQSHGRLYMAAGADRLGVRDGRCFWTAVLFELHGHVGLSLVLMTSHQQLG